MEIPGILLQNQFFQYILYQLYTNLTEIYIGVQK